MGNVIKLQRKKKPKPQRQLPPWAGIFVFLLIGAVGYYTIEQLPRPGSPVTGGDESAMAATFTMCGRDRFTCVVDGDTIWLKGENLRLQSYDTPEPHTGVCGGDAEIALAKRASARLLDLLNSNEFTVEKFGMDSTGERRLATIRIDGRDVGDILIDEGLARRWPDGKEFWC